MKSDLPGWTSRDGSAAVTPARDQPGEKPAGDTPEDVDPV
jgi:hypothetical protein